MLVGVARCALPVGRVVITITCLTLIDSNRGCHCDMARLVSLLFALASVQLAQSADRPCSGAVSDPKLNRGGARTAKIGGCTCPHGTVELYRERG